MLHGFRLAKQVSIDMLCNQFRSLTVHIDRVVPGYFPLRRFAVRVQQDQSHLDMTGFIKKSIINNRISFLLSNKLLSDRIVFQDHVIYANRHLYTLDHIDCNGFTNLERMKLGMRPIALNGKELIVIHHLEQTHRGTWIVIPDSFHCKFDAILHSQVRTPDPVRRKEFKQESREFWKEEARLREELSAVLRKPKI